MNAELMTRAQSARCISYKGTLAAAINERLIGRHLVPPRAAEWFGLFRFGKSMPVRDAMNVASAEIVVRNGRVTIYLWSGEREDDPATLEHLPPIEAKVITLPTAAAIAPIQPVRRGRFPRNVTPIRRGLELRRGAEQRARMLHATKETKRACIETLQYLDRQIADLQARDSRGGSA